MFNCVQQRPLLTQNATFWHVILVFSFTILILWYQLFTTTTTPDNLIQQNVPGLTSLSPAPVHTGELGNYDQTDPKLIHYVATHLISNGFKSRAWNRQYFGYSTPNRMMRKIWPILRKAVSGQSAGFFVEAGAYDGITASNTLWLEQVHRWTGLLVECHPELLPKLFRANRKAYIASACLSRTTKLETAEFTSIKGWAASSLLGTQHQIQRNMNKTSTVSKFKLPQFNNSTIRKYRVQTIPLFTLLSALNVTVVDFISLDIQRTELDVLKSFPFDKVLVKVWLIEIILYDEDNLQSLRTLMQQNGYLDPIGVSDMDECFVHKSVVDNYL